MIRYRCLSALSGAAAGYQIRNQEDGPPFLNENVEIVSFNILRDNTFYNLIINMITICIIFCCFTYFPRVCAVHCKSARRPLF